MYNSIRFYETISPDFLIRAIQYQLTTDEKKEEFRSIPRLILSSKNPSVNRIVAFFHTILCVSFNKL